MCALDAIQLSTARARADISGHQPRCDWRLRRRLRAAWQRVRSLQPLLPLLLRFGRVGCLDDVAATTSFLILTVINHNSTSGHRSHLARTLAYCAPKRTATEGRRGQRKGGRASTVPSTLGLLLAPPSDSEQLHYFDTFTGSQSRSLAGSLPGCQTVGRVHITARCTHAWRRTR